MIDSKRRRGRPRNEGNKGMITHIHVRLSAEQREMLEAWAGIVGLSMSSFIREELSCLLCDKISEKSVNRNRRPIEKA